jgi:hypothetical protein
MAQQSSFTTAPPSSSHHLILTKWSYPSLKALLPCWEIVNSLVVTVARKFTQGRHAGWCLLLKPSMNLISVTYSKACRCSELWLMQGYEPTITAAGLRTPCYLPHFPTLLYSTPVCKKEFLTLHTQCHHG